MKRLPLVTIIGLLLVLLLVACGGETSGQTSDPNTLTAVKVDATSLDANAAYWGGAPRLRGLEFRVVPEDSARILRPGVLAQKLHKVALDASRRSGGFGL